MPRATWRSARTPTHRRTRSGRWPRECRQRHRPDRRGAPRRVPRVRPRRPGEAVTSWLELALLIVLLGISIPFFGNYMAKVFGGGRAPGDRVFLPVERLVYRVGRIDPD